MRARQHRISTHPVLAVAGGDIRSALCHRGGHRSGEPSRCSSLWIYNRGDVAVHFEATGFRPGGIFRACFVATLVDVCGLIIYFTIAAVILRGILL